VLLDVEEKKRGIDKKTTTNHDPKLVGEMIGSFIENGKVAVLKDGSTDLTCSDDDELKQLNQDALAHASTRLASDPILHANTS
jgi:hypothetical protein